MYRAIQADWKKYAEQLLFIRNEVFTKEQNIPSELDDDGLDHRLYHILVFYTENDKEDPIATGRMSKGGKIGRLSVLQPHRKKGVGKQIISLFEEIAISNGIENLSLSAQIHAQEFYEKIGFKVIGEPYSDVGIPHITMVKPLILTP